jgi:C4-dicarboxylate transporter
MIKERLMDYYEHLCTIFVIVIILSVFINEFVDSRDAFIEHKQPKKVESNGTADLFFFLLRANVLVGLPICEFDETSLSFFSEDSCMFLIFHFLILLQLWA